MSSVTLTNENGEGSKMRNFIVCTVHLIVIKSRRLRWARRVARMEEGRSAFKILTGKPFNRKETVREA